VADALVQIRGLTKVFYGQTVLSKISLEIERGEVFGYIGPNGAGKTTTLKILAGLIGKYEGDVVIAGANVAKEREKTHKLIGYLPQGAGFQQWRTVESALDSLGALSGVPADLRRQRINLLLERFELASARHKKVKELSGGMTQKLGLIQALLHQPPLLVLDEPLEGLDPPSRNLLKDIIRERQREGTTVLFSSHILSDVEDVADRVGILHGGKLATSGSIRELTRAFGLPLEIEIDFVTPPSATDFLGEHGEARQGKPNQWRIRLAKDADSDAAIGAVVERTLATGGKLRKIGLAEPDLDRLFGEYLKREQHAA
jgi:ABC-2 type transport system ATP-binding protein